jgi:anti-sigma factor RsiW
MNCEQYRQLISALVDKELNEGEQVILNEHLTQCSECVQYSEQIRELGRLTTEWEASAMPSDLEQAILERAKQKPQGWLGRLWGGSYRIPRPVAWAAAVAILVLTINAVGPPGGSDRIGPAEGSPVMTRPVVQRIVLTESDVVRTYTTQAVSEDM